MDQENSVIGFNQFVMPQKALNLNIEIIIALTPCQFATGEEHRFAKKLPNVHSVLKPKETFKLALSCLFKSNKKNNTSTALLYLGGGSSLFNTFKSTP